MIGDRYMEFKDKDEMFRFEMQYCFEHLEVWLHEAQNLFYSAEVLYEFETLRMSDSLERNEEIAALFPDDLTRRAIFNHKVQRMLWAFGFENLLKCLILANIKREKPEVREVPLDQIATHNLLWLSGEARVVLSKLESFYLGILAKCSEWAGRYPLPRRSNKMYDKRTALESQDFDRYQRGEIPRLLDESDVLYTPLATMEYEQYRQLKDRLITQVEGVI